MRGREKELRHLRGRKYESIWWGAGLQERPKGIKWWKRGLWRVELWLILSGPLELATVADPGRQVRGGDLYISYLGLPGVRYLAGLSGILDLYRCKNDSNTGQCKCE